MPIDVQALFPKLINLLLDTVFVVDEAGHIVFVSDACERLLGYTAAEMTGQKIFEFIHPADQEPTRRVAREVNKGQPRTNIENRYLHKDGSIVYLLWSARWYEEDRLRIGVARDITALRRADQTKNALYQISEAAHDADTLRALCSGIRNVISELFPGDTLHLAFYDADEKSLRVPDWDSEHPDGWLETAIEAGTPLARVISDRQPLLESRQEPAHDNAKLPAGDWLGVPLLSRESVLGILILERTSIAAPLTHADQELLQFVATQVATMVERKKADEELRFMAHHDALTGLTNRALFYDLLETSLQAAIKKGQRLALLYLDLNDFKRINDTWGHEAGDELIREVARRLVHGTRKTDTIGRMGGDEFTVLLTDIDGASGMVEKSVGKIREILAHPVSFDGQSISVTSSIGVALYPEDGDTARQLIIRADANMYVDKYGG
jgi:diguanylate cyclase (GGDEF)-like protein/PAS domain S-box-containing protein